MKKFLKYVAEDIINKYGTDLSRIAVVFPNKRASIFLNEQLAVKAQRPMWSPSYITISDFFRQHSLLTVGDPIKLICDIHKSFVRCTGINESLDHFFGWGQLLLSDFDDIDKNMADASNIFKNIKDIHELDDISYLTEDQKAILQKFFSNFTDDNESELKKRFLKLWCHIGEIYNDFQQRLHKQNIAYEGMLYRDVANCETINYKYDKYLFIGFNVIQKVEQQVFRKLQKENKAYFYWDFDNYYMPESSNSLSYNEAGHYVSQYLKHFPNELDSMNGAIYDNFNKDKDITYISASTENIQAKYINNWLIENDRYKKGKNTAIVLCNESLLPTVIHCFPKEVDNINITTGFPLFQTPISSFIIQLMELKINGYSVNNRNYRIHYVTQILSHPYAQYLSNKCVTLLDELKTKKIYYPTSDQLSVDDNTSLLFCLQSENATLVQWVLNIIKIIADNSTDKYSKDPLFLESVFRMYTLCNRINELIKSGDLDVDIITLQKLIIQLINSTSIPFHGEPAEGIQVMGILETRNLDFEHVLILSCNEGNMPKGVNDSSFIPYSIRKAYELTTIDNKVAIYAYYFYNLIQRASDVTIIYNNSTENGHMGEMSRFMLQLMTESNFDIKRISLQTGQQLLFNQPREIPKDNKIIKVLNSINYISPTAINRYMRCPLQFYYNNIAQIRESDDDEFEDMSNRVFGNIFHSASELLYKKLIDINHIVSETKVNDILKHKELIERIVDEAFNRIVFNQKNENNRPVYNGLQLINREVIIRYIRRLLEIDKSLAPFKIKDIEYDVYKNITIKTSDGIKEICIGGRIDRLDQVTDKEKSTERIRIIDYKTGSYPPKKINGIDEIFRRPIESGKHTDYYLQTMLYSIIIKNDEKYNERNLPVSPSLLFIQHTLEDNYDPTISIGKNRVYDIAEYEEEFYGHLIKILIEIFESQIPFRPTEDRTVCTYCPYHNMCGI